LLVLSDRDQRLKYSTGKVESLAGRYHHPSRAAGFPGPLPVLIRAVSHAVAVYSGLIKAQGTKHKALSTFMKIVIYEKPT
jgi:hypothetical protein